MKVGLLLIALGFGYKIFAEARKEAGFVKRLGQLVGVVMMVTSLIGTVCVIGSIITKSQGRFLGSPYWCCPQGLSPQAPR